MKTTKKRLTEKTPKFTSEDEEARWWASAEGRAYLGSQTGPECVEKKQRGSTLVTNLNHTGTTKRSER
jgi:hypothetical protein